MRQSHAKSFITKTIRIHLIRLALLFLAGPINSELTLEDFMAQHDAYLSAATGISKLRELGTRVDAWKKQRAVLAAEIQSIVLEGQKILTELSDAPVSTGPGKRGGRPKGYRASPATREKLRAAWRRRKAAMKS
jgi:hypothetical protein